MVFAGAVVEGRHRLQALSHADGHREDEHKNAGHNAHARHGGIAVAAGGNVQQHPADAVQPLTAKAGCAACKDLQKLARLPGDGGKPELADRFAPQEHIQQNAKADGLAEGGGDTGTGSAQPQPEHEQRVQCNVQQSAGDQPDHGKVRLALIPQDVVHHQTGDHQRCGKQDGPGVGTGMGQNGFGTAQQHHEVRQGGKTDHRQHYAKGQRSKKAGGSKAGGGVGILTAQAAADDGAGAVPQHKAQRLNDGHQAGNDTHRAGSAGGDAPYKKGIGQIVDAGDQHT